MQFPCWWDLAGVAFAVLFLAALKVTAIFRSALSWVAALPPIMRSRPLVGLPSFMRFKRLRRIAEVTSLKRMRNTVRRLGYCIVACSIKSNWHIFCLPERSCAALKPVSIAQAPGLNVNQSL